MFNRRGRAVSWPGRAEAEALPGAEPLLGADPLPEEGRRFAPMRPAAGRTRAAGRGSVPGIGSTRTRAKRSISVSFFADSPVETSE